MVKQRRQSRDKDDRGRNCNGKDDSLTEGLLHFPTITERPKNQPGPFACKLVQLGNGHVGRLEQPLAKRRPENNQANDQL